MRTSEIKRVTLETDVCVRLDLDGGGNSEISTGCGFLDHMLTALAKHGRFDLKVTCSGDTQVDDHHSVEDIGFVFGQAFDGALGDKKGIRRFGEAILPMDEALILSAVDISGRSFLGYDLPGMCEKVGTFDTELVKEFWLGFVRGARITLHLRKLSGENTHHTIEAAFKSAARSLRMAAEADPRCAGELPTTKGTLQ